MRGNDSPAEPDSGAVTGTYNLIINFDGLPGTTWNLIKRGDISLHADGTFVDRVATQGRGNPEYTHVLTGYCEFIADSTVELRYSGRRPAVYDTAVISGRTFTKLDCNGSVLCAPERLRYRK